MCTPNVLHRFPILAGGVFVLASLPARANEFQLGPPTLVGTGPQVYDALSVDVDGDADLDVVVASPQSKLYIQINQGDGQFVLGAEYPLPDWGEEVAAGNVDADEHLDLVVISRDTHLTVFLGDGQGGFTPLPDLPLSGIPSDLQLGDLNGDGLTDAAISWWGEPGGGLEVLFGDGTGGFAPGADFVLDSHCFDMDLADLDGDQDVDVLVSRYTPGTALVFLNDGGGNLSAPVEYGMGNGCWDLVAADMDGDGDLDILSTNRNEGSVSVRRNDGTGVFEPRTVLMVNGFPVKSEPLDLDADGDLDVLTLRTDGKLRILANDGTGALTIDSTKQFPGVSYSNLIVGDFDQDEDVEGIAIPTNGEMAAIFNSTEQENPFLVCTNHLLAGGMAEISVENGVPGGLVLLVASLTGPGSGIYVPFLDVSTNLMNPRRPAPPQFMDLEGNAAWTFPLPAVLRGLPIWFQALQQQESSNILASQVN